MDFNKNDFIDWQTHPITQAFRRQLQSVIEENVGTLVNQAGLDSGNDRELRGAINAYTEMYEWQPEWVPSKEEMN